MTTHPHGFFADGSPTRLGGKARTHLTLRKRLIGTWIWTSKPAQGVGKHLALSWRLDADDGHRVLQNLKGKSDHELADIGLAQSDLSLEGLVAAGVKRARQQDRIAAEVIAHGQQQRAGSPRE